MAIAVSTNGTTSPRQPVSLTILSVSGYNTADLVESKSVTKTPLTANATTASSPDNTLSVSPVRNTTLSVTSYNYSDMSESKSITKTPIGTSVPSAPGYSTGTASYGGSVSTVRITTREIWITG